MGVTIQWLTYHQKRKPHKLNTEVGNYHLLLIAEHARLI